jgi:hypothetical protein
LALRYKRAEGGKDREKGKGIRKIGGREKG